MGKLIMDWLPLIQSVVVLLAAGSVLLMVKKLSRSWASIDSRLKRIESELDNIRGRT